MFVSWIIKIRFPTTKYRWRILAARFSVPFIETRVAETFLYATVLENRIDDPTILFINTMFRESKRINHYRSYPRTILRCCAALRPRGRGRESSVQQNGGRKQFYCNVCLVSKSPIVFYGTFYNLVFIPHNVNV